MSASDWNFMRPKPGSSFDPFVVVSSAIRSALQEIQKAGVPSSTKINLQVLGQGEHELRITLEDTDTGKSLGTVWVHDLDVFDEYADDFDITLFPEAFPTQDLREV